MYSHLSPVVQYKKKRWTGENCNLIYVSSYYNLYEWNFPVLAHLVLHWRTMNLKIYLNNNKKIAARGLSMLGVFCHVKDFVHVRAFFSLPKSYFSRPKNFWGKNLFFFLTCCHFLQKKYGKKVKKKKIDFPKKFFRSWKIGFGGKIPDMDSRLSKKSQSI